MTTLTCAISGLNIEVPYFADINIAKHCGYFHPIFAADSNTIKALVGKYKKGTLTPTENYLLFLAIANNSKLITWHHPLDISRRTPDSDYTQRIIANKLLKLIKYLAQSEKLAATKSDFSQPQLIIRLGSNNLRDIANYITVLKDNINEYLHFKQDMALTEQINKTENALTLAIKSSAHTSDYTDLIANWARVAAGFPADKVIAYKAVIINSFNEAKMFNTPLELIKEVKDYCENNIEAGSIHFHELTKALNAAIINHEDYLGASFNTTYTLESLDGIEDSSAPIKNKEMLSLLTSLKAKAPTTEPIRSNYANLADYIKAKLAYSLSKDNSGVTND